MIRPDKTILADLFLDAGQRDLEQMSGLVQVPLRFLQDHQQVCFLTFLKRLDFHFRD